MTTVSDLPSAGIRVRFWPMGKTPQLSHAQAVPPYFDTETAGRVFHLSGGKPVVKLKGLSGYKPLSHIDLLPPQAETVQQGGAGAYNSMQGAGP
jgi:hypothetical protein